MLLVLLVTLKTLAYPLSLYCSGLVLGTLAPVNDATLPHIFWIACVLLNVCLTCMKRECSEGLDRSSFLTSWFRAGCKLINHSIRSFRQLNDGDWERWFS
jgi:hypothetical protein